MTDLPRMALSIRQPWAWAIISAGKDIENRDWPTRFRGPVCIHAAKGMTVEEWRESSHWIRVHFGQLAPLLSEIQRGGIIGTAEIVDCIEASDSPWFFGRYGFVLRNVQSVDFIPVRGALGFFDWRQQPPPAPEKAPTRKADRQENLF
jgi:hypothetical protein